MGQIEALVLAVVGGDDHFAGLDLVHHRVDLLGHIGGHAIPSFATAPALVIVGLYMLTNVTNIDFNDMSEAIPCYVCIIAMPFFYSISEGISMGVITYVALNLITGKAKEKKVSILMYVLAVLFILKYVFL